MRFLISAIEVAALLVILVLALSLNVLFVIWLSLALLLAAAVVVITGWKLPRVKSRSKALAIAVIASACLFASAIIFQEQREEHLADLLATDIDAYLSELMRIDDKRWLDALEELRPQAYAEEITRREQQAAIERERACSRTKVSEAFVMIQADVRNRLKSPSTAKFPTRYSNGTKLEADCIYRVVSYVDAQNDFGAMLRNNFSGRIEYFPDKGAWLTLELHIDN